MKKFLFSVMVIVAVCFSLTGCGSASDAEPPITRVNFLVIAPTQEEVLAYRDSLDLDKYKVIEIDKMYYGNDKNPDAWYMHYQEKDTNTEEHTHSWIEKDVDGKSVTICEGCGTIKEGTSTEEHSHIWDVKEVGDKVVVFCKECGKMAE